MDEWKKRREEALKIAEKGKHAWFFFKNDNFLSCAKCGVIQNTKNKDANCSGPVDIVLRN